MINTYSLRINRDKIPYLCKENEIEYKKGNKMNNPQKIVEMVNTCFQLDEQAEEHVIMLALEAKKNVIGLFEISHGSISSAECAPENIMKRALLCSASSVVVVHNHPSQDISASAEDIKIADMIDVAGQLLHIKLDDFIIVGGEKHYSFYEEKLLS